MKNKILSVLTCSLIIGCSEVPVEQTKYMDLTVIEVDEPKYFRIYFKTDSGLTDHAYSKRCSDYRNVAVGDRYSVEVSIFKYEDGTKKMRINESACNIARHYKKI